MAYQVEQWWGWTASPAYLAPMPLLITSFLSGQPALSRARRSWSGIPALPRHAAAGPNARAAD